MKLDIMRRADFAKFSEFQPRPKAYSDRHGGTFENSPHEPFWGIGQDGAGANWAGRVLMRSARFCPKEVRPKPWTKRRPKKLKPDALFEPAQKYFDRPVKKAASFVMSLNISPRCVLFRQRTSHAASR